MSFLLEVVCPGEARGKCTRCRPPEHPSSPTFSETACLPLALIDQPLLIVEGPGARIITNGALMRHHALPRLPAVQQKARRLQHEMGRAVGLQVKGHLMGEARRAHRQGTGKARLQAAMQMPARTVF